VAALNLNKIELFSFCDYNTNMSLPKDLLTNLAFHHKHLQRGNALYAEYETIIYNHLQLLHDSSKPTLFLGEVGQINFPFFEMGNRSSAHLFGLDELMIFSFYFMNTLRYKRVLDLGANLGLHSLVLKKLGYEVISYEPDFHHAQQFRKVMRLNNLDDSGFFEKAVGTENGFADFVRVLNNTTGSHLKGVKESYGPLELCKVEVVDILQIVKSHKFDLIKMDVEGNEANLIQRLNQETFKSVDIILEIGSKKNAHLIFEIVKENGVCIYSQKNQWNIVDDIDMIPIHHSEGSAFISYVGPPLFSK
jgi:FkbM family methyltransferase